MKKIFLFLFIIITLSKGENEVDYNISEYDIDIYYVNGAATLEDTAKNHHKKLQEIIFDMKTVTYKNELNGMNVRSALAYNHTSDEWDDYLESFRQKRYTEERNFIDLLIEAIPTFLSEIYLAFFTDVNNQYKEDLQNHIEKYEHSIKSGHKVLAIGHSQGNLFINQEYKLLDDWMKMYFSAVAIATPANNVIGDESSTAPYVTFYNDMITELVKESFEGNTEGNLSASWTELDNHELETYLNPSF